MSAPTSRRAFLGWAAALVAVPVAVRELLKNGGSAARPVSAAAPRVRGARGAAENALTGDSDWGITTLGAPDAIMGYADRASVLPGESVNLYVSTVGRSFTVSAYRMGWYGGDQARLVWRSGSVRGTEQRQPDVTSPTNTVTAGWGESLTVSTDDWPEGCYLLRLDSEAGPQRYVPLTVRSAVTAGKTVIKNSVPTWHAYNTWGGYDLYWGPGGPSDYDNRALAVSLDRPYDENGASTFLTHEQKLIALAERLGLPLAYTTSMDISADPALLTGASSLIALGHDEYWTPQERNAVTAARDAGMNIAFLGANAMFRRTRQDDTPLGTGRLIICYKTSYAQDPMYGVDDAMVTSDWREPPNPDPESPLTGTYYESNPVNADYVVTTPDAWMFAGTGVTNGTTFPSLVGIEYDRVNPGVTVERPIQVLAHSPLTCRGVHSYADSAYYTHSGGAGVLNVGTMRWVRSLDGRYGIGDQPRTGAFTSAVTTNVLHAFADGPAAAKYPAQDNLATYDEYAGDPIGAGHDLW